MSRQSNQRANPDNPVEVRAEQSAQLVIDTIIKTIKEQFKRNKEWAEYSNTDTSTVSRFMAGNRDVNLFQFFKFCELLKINPLELIQTAMLINVDPQKELPIAENLAGQKLIKFYDKQGKSCAIQESSTPDHVWIGAVQSTDGQDISGQRMLINNEQIQKLIPALTRFAHTSDLGTP